MTRSSLMMPVFLSISYLLCEPFGISTMTFIASFVPGSISCNKFMSVEYNLFVFRFVAIFFFIGDGLVARGKTRQLLLGRKLGYLRGFIGDNFNTLGRHNARRFGTSFVSTFGESDGDLGTTRRNDDDIPS